ncbi:MAG: ABC transporter ATP-binding protein [Lachnospiraceae bacterium]|nr:ABC transporter ATP-binding protein [Lachnospiraceae bacterium]
MDYVLTTSGLSKQYRKKKALSGASLHIEKGAIYGLIGPNGAGKTSLFRIICGLQRPTEGSYAIFGVDNSQKDITKSYRRMGALIERATIYPDMTAEENLRQQAMILGLSSYDSIPEILTLVGLEDQISRPAEGKNKTEKSAEGLNQREKTDGAESQDGKAAGMKKQKEQSADKQKPEAHDRLLTWKFSLGMKQRLGIAMALLGNPDFLILDEPTNGLDPQGIIELRELILKLNREQGITFLIASHNLDELARVATHFGFLKKGELLQEISAKSLNESFRKCVRVKVSDITALTRVLDKENMSYEVLPGGEANIYQEVSLSKLVFSLAEENCELLSSEKRDESLEDYFLNLIGEKE